MDAQLRDLLGAAVGDPPHRVTVAAVRRRVIRRRVLDGVAVTAVAALIAGIGVAVSAGAQNPGATAGSARRAGAPRFYVQLVSKPGRGQLAAMVRSTASGAVTAGVRCPWPNAGLASQGLVAAGDRIFFIDCQRVHKADGQFVFTGSRVYRFQLTRSGRISGYSLVPGGTFGRGWVEDITASDGGEEVAVSIGPARIRATSPAPVRLFVINTQTGAHAVWYGGPAVSSAGNLTFTHQGTQLTFVTSVRCGPAGSTGRCRELRAVSPAAAGGQLDSSRLLLRFSALTSSPQNYINEVVISPDASTVTAAVIHSPNRPHASTSILVIRYSAVTGRRLRVLFSMRTGNGMFYRFFGADPTGRYLLFNAGPTSGTVNGWIYRGRLIRLKPANGSNVMYETW